MNEPRSWPCKIRNELRNLRSLELCGAAIADEVLAKLLSGLVVLERLIFYSCHMLENIFVHGGCLKKLGLHDCDGLASVAVDAPKLNELSYTGDVDIKLVATNIPARSEVYFNVYPEVFDTHWFIKLKKFLTESNICQALNVLMLMDAHMVAFNDKEAIKLSDIPPYKLQKLSISLPSTMSPTSLSNFVDGLFWSCRPDQLSIPVSLSSRSTIPESLIQLLKSRVENWWHPLTRIEAVGTDLANLLESSETEIELHFKLHWCMS